MTLWQQLQDSLQQVEADHALAYHPESDLLQQVEDLSLREGQPPEMMVLLLLEHAVCNWHRVDRTNRGWDALSERERQVAAWVCEGLTGRQVAMRLVLSPETIKTHVRHILKKFQVTSRHELRRLLDDWDLSPWLVDSRV